ncbi:hypothetical protein BBD26_1694 [Lactobacillus delbrueckii subsp. bulgaricus]|nr:hypothetical protein BBD26_1694 [Lactobacillus delbrueckii subsp. bulgaricus]
MDAKTRKALQDFGFRIEEDGKHYRLTSLPYHGGQDAAKRCPRREEYRALY